MKKLSVLLIVIMLLSSFSAMNAFGAGIFLTDISGTVYENAVSNLISKGVISGYPDGTFKPVGNITRAEACKVVVLAMEDGGDLPLDLKESTFTDMAAHKWASLYVNYAVHKGIIQGYGNNIFKPGQNVTFSEMSAMLVRACGISEASLVGEWPLNYVNKASELGVFTDITEDVTEDNWYGKSADRGNTAIMTNNVFHIIRNTEVPNVPSGGGNGTSTDPGTGESSNGTGNPSSLDGYQGKLSGYSGRAYGMINEISDAVNSSGNKVKRISFMFGDEELELNSSKDSIAVPQKSEYLNGTVFCVKMSDGIVTAINKVSGAGTPSTFVELTANSANVAATAGGFGIVLSRNNYFMTLAGPATSPEYPVTIVDDASLYICEFDENGISGYKKARISDIKKGAYVRAYTVVEDDAGMADIVLIVDVDDVNAL